MYYDCHGRKYYYVEQPDVTLEQEDEGFRDFEDEDYRGTENRYVGFVDAHTGKREIEGF